MLPVGPQHDGQHAWKPSPRGRWHPRTAAITADCTVAFPGRTRRSQILVDPQEPTRDVWEAPWGRGLQVERRAVDAGLGSLHQHTKA